MKIPQTLLGCLLTLTGALQADTAFNINYSFTGSQLASPTTVTGDVIGSAMAWNGFTAQVGFSGSSNTAYVRADQLTSTMDLGKYLEFTISASEADILNLSSISFSLGGSSSSATNSPTTYSVLRIGAPNADFSVLPDVMLTPGSTTTASNQIPASSTSYTTYTADLSSAAFQNVDSLTFRLYTFSNSSSGTVFLRFNDITVQGTTAAIPENNASIVLGLIATLILALRFKRHLKR